MSLPVVTPEGWYQLWWAGAFIAARLFLVQPIIRAIRESKR